MNRIPEHEAFDNFPNNIFYYSILTSNMILHLSRSCLSKPHLSSASSLRLQLQRPEFIRIMSLHSDSRKFGNASISGQIRYGERIGENAFDTTNFRDRRMSGDGRHGVTSNNSLGNATDTALQRETYLSISPHHVGREADFERKPYWQKIPR